MPGCWMSECQAVEYQGARVLGASWIGCLVSEYQSTRVPGWWMPGHQGEGCWVPDHQGYQDAKVLDVRVPGC